MLKALIVGVILGAALVLGGVWVYFTSGRAPVAVTDPPLPFEKKLAHASLNAHLDKQQRSEPAVPADETTFLAGAEVYKHNCAVCHGLPGVAPTAISEGEYPKPPELFKGTGVTDDPAWESYWKAANGIRLTGIRRTGERPVQQRPQLGPVARVGVIGYPGLRHGPQLSLSRHVHHSFQLVLTRYSKSLCQRKILENPGFADDLGGNRPPKFPLSPYLPR